METKLYNQEGKEIGKVELPENKFGLKWNADLVHQVVTSMRANLRHGTAHAKGRGEVSGGGKKPWRQKGTGRARHGSIRSPIWVGGGVSHGPKKEKDYSKKINRKMAKRALYTVLSAKARDGEIKAVDEIKLSKIKTKDASKILKNLKIDRRTLILAEKRDEKILKSFRNIQKVEVGEARNLNALIASIPKYLIFVGESWKAI